MIEIQFRNNAEQWFERRGIMLWKVRATVTEFKTRLEIPNDAHASIVFTTIDWGRDPHGSFNPRTHEILVKLPWSADLLPEISWEAVLIHEMAHLKRHLSGRPFYKPSIFVLESHEEEVEYYASSLSELEALAWEASVCEYSKALLREVIAKRLSWKH